MRLLRLGLLFVAGCAAASSPGSVPATRTSVVEIGGGRGSSPEVISVQAGVVRLMHSIPSGARLRATTLEGLDEANRHLSYEWTRDGEFNVEVSGRYRHAVSGSIVGGGRLTSTLMYAPYTGSTVSSRPANARSPSP